MKNEQLTEAINDTADKLKKTAQELRRHAIQQRKRRQDEQCKREHINRRKYFY